MGEAIFRALNKPVPDFYNKIQENKWTWIIATWFIGGQLQAGLLSTGAFEIYVNDALEFSKIQTGGMPDMNVINNILAKHNIGA